MGTWRRLSYGQPGATIGSSSNTLRSSAFLGEMPNGCLVPVRMRVNIACAFMCRGEWTLMETYWGSDVTGRLYLCVLGRPIPHSNIAHLKNDINFIHSLRIKCSKVEISYSRCDSNAQLQPRCLDWRITNECLSARGIWFGPPGIFLFLSTSWMLSGRVGWLSCIYIIILRPVILIDTEPFCNYPHPLLFLFPRALTALTT